MEDNLDRTLTELERDDWGDAEVDSDLASTIHRLRYKPIGTFTVEDLRITIGQAVGLSYLVPLAISHLERDPLAEGDYYAGDLLAAVLRLPESFWAANAPTRSRLVPAAKRALAQSDDSSLNQLCTDFIARWKA